MQGRQGPGNVLRALALLTAVAAVGGTVLTFSGLRGITLQEGRRSAAFRAAAVARDIDATLLRNLRAVEAIAGDENIRRAVGGSRKNLSGTRDHLLFYRRSFGFRSCTVLDGEGNLITSTDPTGALWHAGEGAPAPSWFVTARRGEAGIHLTVGKDENDRRVVYSRPVYDRGDSPAGVAYVETSADEISPLMSDSGGGILLLAERDGPIYLSSRAELLDRSLWNGGSEGPPWSGLSRLPSGEARDRKESTWEIHEAELQCCPGWTVTYLHDLKAFAASRSTPVIDRAWYGAAGFCLVAVLAAAALWLSAGTSPAAKAAPAPETHLRDEDEEEPPGSLSPADMGRAVRANLGAVIDLTGSLLAERSGNLTAEEQDRLRLVRGRTARLRGLLDDIIDVGRIEAEHLTADAEPFNAANLLREASCSFDAVAAGKGVLLSSRIGGEHYMHADRERVRKALAGLVRAGLLQTPHGGSITLGAAGEDGQIRFTVTSTGNDGAAGDSEAPRHSYGGMHAGATGEEEAAGLALYVSERLARHLGGSLETALLPGNGSEFTLTLPAGRDGEG